MKYWFLLLLCGSLPFYVSAQWDYPSFEALKTEIQRISSTPLAVNSSIGKSYSGQDIPIIKIQTGDTPKPTLLLVAGVDGQHPAGIIQSIQVVKNILGLPSQELTALLESKSIWVVPILNVDAYKRNSGALTWSSGNGHSIDNDRDGRQDEDPQHDLNKDGVISQMRIKSPAGSFNTHAKDQDYMVLADRSKGQVGSYVLMVEGIDLDQDGRMSEDDESGVNIDKNFTFDYPFFEPGSGDYAASEPETRAIIDLIFKYPQIASVIHFGLQNNLSIPEEFDQQRANERIVRSWTKNDVAVSTMISQFYNELVKPLGSAPKLPAEKGNFSNTIYYHTGKFSFVTPSWWIPSDTSKTKIIPFIKTQEDKFVNWVKSNQIQGALLPWKEVAHPNFPNELVEVGGMVSVFKHNPPVAYLENSGKIHAEFILKLAKSMASLEFSQPKITHLGDEIFRVEIQVYNVGLMPIYPEIADKIQHVSKLKSVIEIQKDQKFLSGKRLQLYPSLAAGSSTTMSWLIKGKGKLQLIVGCPSAGEKIIDINL